MSQGKSDSGVEGFPRKKANGGDELLRGSRHNPLIGQVKKVIQHSLLSRQMDYNHKHVFPFRILQHSDIPNWQTPLYL